MNMKLLRQQKRQTEYARQQDNAPTMNLKREPWLKVPTESVKA
jgi:hypothetical protein